MTQTIEAIYENNVLKPLSPVEGLLEHQQVQITLDVSLPSTSLTSLAGTLTHAEAEEMQKLIDREFERVDNGW